MGTWQARKFPLRLVVNLMMQTSKIFNLNVDILLTVWFGQTRETARIQMVKLT